MQTPIGDRYLPERPLGEGGMGAVWLARDLKTDERVAVKLLRPSLAADATQRARFFREAYAAASLQSEHVVHVREVGALPDGTPFLVMEYLEGTDLGAILEQQTILPVEAAVGYVAQACEGLAEAHSKGIVHRDIKPANLLLTRRPGGSWLVKVLDFGVARAASSGASLTLHQEVLGSPHTMAPEQLDSTHAELAPSADVWALGCVLYRLLAGRYPHDGGTLQEMLVSIATGHVAPLSRGDVPEPLSEVIRACLRLDPAQRYPDAGALLQALAPWTPAWARPRTPSPTLLSTPAPVGVAPMAGAEQAVAGGKRKKAIQPWQAVLGAALAAVLGGALVVGVAVSTCGSVVLSSMPTADNNDLSAPLHIPDPARVDPIALLPQIDDAVRKLEPRARLTVLQTYAKPAGLVDLATHEISAIYAVPDGPTVAVRVGASRQILVKRARMRGSQQPPPAPPFCKFQHVSRAAVGASPSKPVLHFNLLYEANDARYIWNIDHKIRLDAQTCAPAR